MSPGYQGGRPNPPPTPTKAHSTPTVRFLLQGHSHVHRAARPNLGDSAVSLWPALPPASPLRRQTDKEKPQQEEVLKGIWDGKQLGAWLGCSGCLPEATHSPCSSVWMGAGPAWRGWSAEPTGAHREATGRLQSWHLGGSKQGSRAYGGVARDPVLGGGRTQGRKGESGERNMQKLRERQAEPEERGTQRGRSRSGSRKTGEHTDRDCNRGGCDTMGGRRKKEREGAGQRKKGGGRKMGERQAGDGCGLESGGAFLHRK